MSAAPQGEVLAANRFRGNMRAGYDGVPSHSFGTARNAFEQNDDHRLAGFGNKVSALKTMFQVDKEPRADDNRAAFNRTTSGFAGQRSPEVKRKRNAETNETTHIQAQSQKNADSNIPGVDPHADPQKLFETTNHVQRFQYTRAIFAKMEQQNRAEQEKHKVRTRRLSPHRGRATSPTSPTSRSSPVSFEHRNLSPPPNEMLTKDRSSSDPSRMEIVIEKKSQYRTSGSENAYKRAESMESLDEDSYKRRKPDAPGYKKANRMSRSESDLTRELDEELNHVPSAKQLMQKYEEEARKHNTTSSKPPPPRPNRFMKTEPSKPVHIYASSETNSTSNTTFPNRGPGSGTDSSVSKSEGVSYRSQNRYDSGDTNGDSRSNRYSREDSSYAQRSNRYSIEAPASEDKDEEPSWRRRYNRSEWNENKHTSGTGVLLPKRRSRDEKSLSKEEIEASLSEADIYWKKHNVDEEPGTDNKMSESTYSSGSGEEMARSDSSHDLSGESPTSPTGSETNRRSWSSKYTVNSRNSDELDSKIIDSQRNSRGSGSFEDKTSDMYGVDTVSRSSSESSMKRLSHHEDADTPLSSHHGHQPPPHPGTSHFLQKPPPYTPPIPSVAVDEAEANFLDDRPGSLDVSKRTTTASSASTLSPTLGMKKTPSPNESIDSMTPSEQDTFLAKSEDEVLTEQEVQEAQEFLYKREDGDGHEEPRGLIPDLPDGEEVDDNVEFFEDGSYYFEIDGLPETDADAHLFPNAKKPSRVNFSIEPIRVFSTYSVEDYDRKNEDVDPMAASAEYELEKRVERMDVFPVELEKGPEGLGLSIIGMGVGADAGLEKLGIFIKTLTEGGAAQRDGRIAVNDQIIEVDGKSLVGVTQAYAASVLRNTSGKVQFLIGREKNPQQSEVARLIQQSIEQDRRRAELRRREIEERQREQRELERMHQQLNAKKEALEQELQEELRGRSDSNISTNSVPPPLPDAPPPPEIPAVPHPDDAPEMASPDEGVSPAIEVFDLPEDSSSESVTPEMDPQVLFIKLKEAQYKNAVSEAELAKVKAKMILLENADSQRRQYEKRCEDMAARLRESEKALLGAQKEMANYQDLLEGSQGQYIVLEKSLKDEFQALEKKYHKAKKLIKDYQQREKEFIQEREAILQQQAEKDQQYNALVKSLKDRIFQLEKDLAEACKAAGLPPVIPKDVAPLPRMPEPTRRAELKQLNPDNLSEISSESESSPEISPDKEDSEGGKLLNGTATSDQSVSIVNGGIHLRHEDLIHASEEEDLNAVPETELLDVSANKTKGQLGNSGSLSSRRPPTKSGPPSISQDEDEEDEPFVRHDSDSTVRKNRKKKNPPAPDMAPPYPPPPPPPPPFVSNGTNDPFEIEIEQNFETEPKLATSRSSPKRIPSPLSKLVIDTDRAEGSPKSPASPGGVASLSPLWKTPSPSAVGGSRFSPIWKNAPSELPDRADEGKSEAPRSPKPPVAMKPPVLKPRDKVKNFVLKRPDHPPPDLPPASPGLVVEEAHDSDGSLGDRVESESEARDDQSDTSSISQTSYEPAKPMFSGMASEIPDSVSTATDDSSSGGITLISAKPRGDASSFGSRLFNKSSSSSSMGGVALLSKKPISQDSYGSSDSGGITLLSSRTLDTGYNSTRESSTTLNSYGSSVMVMEHDSESRTQSYDFASATLTSHDDEPPSPRRTGHGQQYQSSPVQEWSVQQVCHWLLAISMDQYAHEFTAKTIDGNQLLQLDANRLKTLGVNNNNDRKVILKRIKDLKTAIEKEKKQMEKEQKAREKLEKQSAASKKKKFPFGK